VGATVGLLLVGANLGWHTSIGAIGPSGVPVSDGSCQPRLAPTKGGSVGVPRRRVAPVRRPEPIAAGATLRRIYPLPRGAEKG